MAQRLRVQTALVKDDSVPSVYHTQFKMWLSRSESAVQI